MDSAKAGRIAKRSSNACARCRKQKIKCSGLQPCENCQRRNVICRFEHRDNKILVTQGYLLDLQDKIARLENLKANNTSISCIVGRDSHTIRNDSVIETEPSQHEELTTTLGAFPNSPRSQSEPAVANLTNPLSTSPSTFVTAPNGRTFYLGTSSNWSFSGKILQMMYEHVYQCPLPTDTLLFDGTAYDLDWAGCHSSHDLETPLVPSHDHSIFLLNAVKFHCGQMFHLFDEEDFYTRLSCFYTDAISDRVTDGIWYIHFLVLLAFGKAFVSPRSSEAPSRRPAGAELFVSAVKLLPDITILCRDPISSTEILCCIALYLQSLDDRSSANTVIGQAMRIALSYGMHTDMPISKLGEAHVQRCRRIWWTIYILDRQLTSLMGLPQSLRDEDILCQLPIFLNAPQRSAAFSMQVKLAQITAKINSTIYGADGRLNGKFLISTKAALETLASVAEELQESFPLSLDKPSTGISRLSASLHLIYHQCIGLAIRPLLFCCLKIKLESPVNLESVATASKVQKLLHICLDSARLMVVILENLQTQGLLENFLSFDLDALFISTMIILVSPVIEARLSEDPTSWLQRSLKLLEEMSSGGNLVASSRKSEAQELDNLLRRLPSSSQAQTLGDTVIPQLIHSPQGMSKISDVLDLNIYEDELSAEQILEVADSIGSDDAEWMARIMVENTLW